MFLCVFISFRPKIHAIIMLKCRCRDVFYTCILFPRIHTIFYSRSKQNASLWDSTRLHFVQTLTAEVWCHCRRLVGVSWPRWFITSDTLSHKTATSLWLMCVIRSSWKLRPRMLPFRPQYDRNDTDRAKTPSAYYTINHRHMTAKQHWTINAL